jgi:hypothetical protein
MTTQLTGPNTDATPDKTSRLSLPSRPAWSWAASSASGPSAFRTPSCRTDRSAWSRWRWPPWAPLALAFLFAVLSRRIPAAGPPPGPSALQNAPGTRQIAPMSSVTSRASFFMTNAVANPVLITLLRSRLGARLGRRLAVVEYVGRRTGTRHRLVTEYSLDGATVHIRVGGADRKTWWRNFRQPAPLRLRLAGVDHEATAQVETHDGEVVVEARLGDPPS